MVKIETKELTMTQVEVEKTAAYGKIDTTYILGIMAFKVKKITGKAWRLVYDGPKCITLIDGTDPSITTTIHDVNEYETEALALKAIEELGFDIEYGEINNGSKTKTENKPEN